MVKKNILKVKREGDFSYPIYFENSFDGLADALKAEGLDSRTLHCYRQQRFSAVYREGKSFFGESF